MPEEALLTEGYSQECQILSPDEANDLLNEINWRRAQALEQHIGYSAEQIFQYLQIDTFEDIPQALLPIAEKLIDLLLTNPTFGNKENISANLRSALLDLVGISHQGGNGVPCNYDTLLKNSSRSISLKNRISSARALALLYQRYENATPESDIKKSVSMAIGHYCAIHGGKVPSEVFDRIDVRTIRKMILEFSKSQEVKNTSVIENSPNQTVENYVAQGRLPIAALYNSKKIRLEIAEIMNVSQQEEARQRKIKSTTQHEAKREEETRKFDRFYNFIKGADCFAERLFRFQEDVIDVNNF